uniref:Uncharacterized protein n=1 Tax=Rhizophora mucronata TaxID=61149 RepID=A0A2P2PYU7_RHIMU
MAIWALGLNFQLLGI